MGMPDISVNGEWMIPIGIKVYESRVWCFFPIYQKPSFFDNNVPTGKICQQTK
jgi:hypothetical protein